MVSLRCHAADASLRWSTPFRRARRPLLAAPSRVAGAETWSVLRSDVYGLPIRISTGTEVGERPTD